MRRARIVWVIGAKLAIALTLSLPANFRRTSVEYRTLGHLAGLEAGASVTLAGQRIGEVIAVDRRGDTTALRVRYVRGAERLPGGRTVRLRRMGLDDSVVLEISLEPPSARVPLTRSFALGGWLTVAADPVWVHPPPSPPPGKPSLPPIFQLLPLPPPPPAPATAPLRQA